MVFKDLDNVSVKVRIILPNQIKYDLVLMT